MSGFREERSIQDVLRDQIRKGEYADEGGSGGGLGGSGGGGGGSGDSEDEGLDGLLDEIQQVVLATLAFIFLVKKLQDVFLYLF